MSKITTDKKLKWVCLDCGNKYGTSRAGTCTVHKGKCDICKKEKHVTSAVKFAPYKLKGE